ncbi:hypothetical protein N7490_004230 [Penicillium lividum]|nr:hypothetical protein N7490_004230 [Penicillium lividum]
METNKSEGPEDESEEEPETNHKNPVLGIRQEKPFTSPAKKTCIYEAQTFKPVNTQTLKSRISRHPTPDTGGHDRHPTVDNLGTN